jgi:hypothetical protein
MFWADQSDDRRVCLLGLEGSLNGNDLANLAKRLRGLAAQGVLRVVVDLRAVLHWDYRGLRCLSEAVAYRQGIGAVTAFITSDRYLKDIAVAAGVAESFDFYDDLRLEGTPAPSAAESAFEAEEPSLRRAMTG